jgi:hypothetical protein
MDRSQGQTLNGRQILNRHQYLKSDNVTMALKTLRVLPDILININLTTTRNSKAMK